MRAGVMTELELNERYPEISVLRQLIGLGYQFLSPEEVSTFRGSKETNVLLETVLNRQLKKLNWIRYNEKKYLFSEFNIQEAIQRLKNMRYDGLQKTNRLTYDFITTGLFLDQSIEGSTKTFKLKYIDWSCPRNNVFHVVPRYVVAHSRSLEKTIVDIVLFVNGIPFVVIECKTSNLTLDQAIFQHIRNQGDNHIPQLFTYAQLLIAFNKDSARYATVGTPLKFWSGWKEVEYSKEDILKQMKVPITDEQKSQLFSGEFSALSELFDRACSQDGRILTEKNQMIYGLCHPKRLLDISYNFMLFEKGVKKISRYQQFFVVKSALSRVKIFDHNGSRAGGLIWHTQGSGKSLTMVMLAKALMQDRNFTNPCIILVSDRREIHDQLSHVFSTCGLDVFPATSGRNFIKLLKEKKGIISTLIHKFEKGRDSEKFVDNSCDIFVLVDESHRSNFGMLAASMRKMLPNACYIGFTGTPLMKKEKNSFLKFGKLIKPSYPFKQAVEDKAVLPLMYEARCVRFLQDPEAVDSFFNRYGLGLSDEQLASLKEKYTHLEKFNYSDRILYMADKRLNSKHKLKNY